MKNNNKSSWGFIFKAILIVGVVFFAYRLGYTAGLDKGKSITTQEFLQKKVNLYGTYFDQNDNLQLNTFSCTPNDLDGDCSRQILANYSTISQHWLDYCRRVSNVTYNNALQGAINLRNSIGSSASIVGPSAICNDGTLSYSANRSGTCSSHGGVRAWY